VNLAELVEDVIRESRTIQKAGARILVEGPLDKVEGHQAYLTQCLSNLLENAVKFVPRGRKPEIVISNQANDSRVRIWIEDNGIGIDAAHHSRIFKCSAASIPQTDFRGDWHRPEHR